MSPPGYSGIRNLSHDPELAKALGNMVVVWAAAESALVGVFATVTGAPWTLAQAGYYRIPTFESRSKVIRSMIYEWQTTEYDRRAMCRSISKLAALSRKRNHWIHSYWAASAAALFGVENTNPKHRAETVIFDFRSPEDDPSRRKPVKAQDVWQHIEAVDRRYVELVQVTQRSSLGTFPLSLLGQPDPQPQSQDSGPK